MTAPNAPTPESRGGRPPSCMTRRARSCLRSLSFGRNHRRATDGEWATGPFADCVLSTARHADDRGDDRRHSGDGGRAHVQAAPTGDDDGVVDQLERLGAQRMSSDPRTLSSNSLQAAQRRRCAASSASSSSEISPSRRSDAHARARSQFARHSVAVPSPSKTSPGYRLLAGSAMPLHRSGQVVAVVDRQSDQDQEQPEHDEDRRLGNRRRVLLGGRPAQKTRPEERVGLALRAAPARGCRRRSRAGAGGSRTPRTRRRSRG